jgi:hypothetical protein
MLTIRLQISLIIAMLALCAAMPFLVHAQTAENNQLRATITAEIMADPRSKDMTQAQIYSLVNALTLQAQEQGLTNSQLTYRPGIQAGTGSTLSSCDGLSCSLAQAFGLDGSIPIIPIALFVLAALFILIYGIMREMGHPHAQG